MKQYPVQMEIEGPFAAFANPASGAGFLTYLVPPFSAVQGMFRAIAWLKRGACIHPTKVEICRPLVLTNLTTNYRGPHRKAVLVSKGASQQMVQQVLQDVCYRLYGEVVPVGPRHPVHDPSHFLMDLFNRRLVKGQCAYIPQPWRRRLLKHQTEDNERVRFLNQFTPAKTDLEYLKPHSDEEPRLRAVILKDYAEHMPEFEIALHTGMRPSEQYGLDWSRVDLKRSSVSLPKTKTGKARHIRLNAVAVSAFKVLQQRSLNGEGPVFVNIQGEALRGYKHWFNPAVEEAGLRDFTWYCLRHTFASRLAMAGVDLLTISELMGHKTIQMTKRYAHLAPEHNQAAVDLLVPVPVPAAPSATTSATELKATEVARPMVVN